MLSFRASRDDSVARSCLYLIMFCLLQGTTEGLAGSDFEGGGIGVGAMLCVEECTSFSLPKI